MGTAAASAEGGESASSSGERPPSDPATARRNAARLRAQAERAAKAGDHGKAYALALSAWRQVDACAARDEACGQLADELLIVLEQYGEAAGPSGAGDAPDSSKTLITR